jgi:hypothetical protein
MSDAGAETIQDLWEKAELIPITAACQKESTAHDVDVM